jgi:hypothetical protein
MQKLSKLYVIIIGGFLKNHLEYTTYCLVCTNPLNIIFSKIYVYYSNCELCFQNPFVIHNILFFLIKFSFVFGFGGVIYQCSSSYLIEFIKYFF